MDAPGKTVFLGGSEDFIFLRVVEVLDIQARLRLPERRLWQRALTVGFERAKVVFEPGDQRNVLDRKSVV